MEWLRGTAAGRMMGGRRRVTPPLRHVHQHHHRHVHQQHQRHVHQQHQRQNAAAAVDRQIVAVRDRFFHTLFVRLALVYMRAVPSSARRLIECCCLLMAVGSLLALIYVHHTLSGVSTECLQQASVADNSRDFILRVEVASNLPQDYTVDMSYAKEEMLRRRRPDSSLLDLIEEFLEVGFGNLEQKGGDSEGDEAPSDDSSVVYQQSTAERDADAVSSEEPELEQVRDVGTDPGNQEASVGVEANCSAGDASVEHEPSEHCQQEHQVAAEHSNTAPSIMPTDSPSLVDVVKSPVAVNLSSMINNQQQNDDNVAAADPVIILDGEQSSSWFSWPKSRVDEEDQTATMSDVRCIMEYSREYGLLRLSPRVRARLAVPVRLVVLDPQRDDSCFGRRVHRLVAAGLISYDDVLLASIKAVVEADDNTGYLRNVVTGDHFRFVGVWSSPTSSLFSALFVIFMFTLTISMLLRYSHQQIYCFVVELLQTMEAGAPAYFPAAPLVTVVLALVGMEAVMSEFFNDSSTAFHVILLVWLVDQFDAVCSHTPITRKHFLRFFYLYHFCFYAYHYRSNGQFSGLALTCCWLFVQHAMIFFLHHYELPAVVRNVHIQRFVVDAIQRDNMRRATQQQQHNNNNNSSRDSSHDQEHAASSQAQQADSTSEETSAPVVVQHDDDEQVEEYSTAEMSDNTDSVVESSGSERR